jgi:hypothetical protein
LTELLWLGISLFAGVITVLNLHDAQRSRPRFRDRGEAYDLQTWANVRREAWRLVSIAGCIGIIIPALSRPGDTPFSVFVLIAMTIPAGIAVNSYQDRRTRRQIERVLA